MLESRVIVSGRSGARSGWVGGTIWLIGLFSVPFLIPYHFMPIPSFYSHWAALLLGVLTLPQVWRRFSGEPAPVPLVAWLFCAVAGIILLQHFWGKVLYLQWLIFPVLALVVAAGVATAGYRGFRRDSERCADAIAWSLLFTGLAQAIFGLCQLVDLEVLGVRLLPRNPGEVVRIAGIIMQANMFAAYLVWSVIATLYLVLRGRLAVWNGVLLGCFLLLVVSFAGSRSTYLYLALIALPLAWALRQLPGRRGWWWPLLIPFVYAALDHLGRSAVGYFLADTAMLREMETQTFGIRQALARDAFELFKSAPLLGHGWGSFIWSRFSLTDVTPVELNDDHSTNLITQLGAETGVVGLVAVLGLVAWWFFRSIRSRLDLPRALLYALLSVVGLYSMLEFPLWIVFYLLPTAWMVGALDSRDSKVAWSRGMYRLAGLAGSLLLVALILSPLDYRRVEVEYAKLEARSGIGSGRAELFELSSLTLFRMEAEQLYVRAWTLDPDWGPFDAAIAARVVATMPAPPYSLAHMLHLIAQGEHAAAEEVLRKTCAWQASYCRALKTDLAHASKTIGGAFKEFETKNLGGGPLVR